MCGRFAITLPDDAMVQLFAAAPANDLPKSPNCNICPTDDIHVVTSDQGRRLRAMRWGFLPHWYATSNGGPLLINARAETLANKPAFGAAARARRCLIPGSGFFEWTKTPEGARLPWYIEHIDSSPLVFAGIWQQWTVGDVNVSTCAIVTCPANEQIRQIHHRMPVILGAQDWALWLGENGKGAARLMKPAPKGALKFHRVTTGANSNRASGANLIEPLMPRPDAP